MMVATVAALSVAAVCLCSCGFESNVSVNVYKKTGAVDGLVIYELDELESEEAVKQMEEELGVKLVKGTYQGRTVYKGRMEKETYNRKQLVANGATYVDRNKSITYLASYSKGTYVDSVDMMDLMDPVKYRFSFNKKPIKANGKIVNGKVVHKTYGKKNVLWTAFNRIPLKAKKVAATVKNGATTSKKVIRFKTRGIIKKMTVNGKNYRPFVVYKDGKALPNCMHFEDPGTYKVKVWLVSGVSKSFTFKYKKA